MDIHHKFKSIESEGGRSSVLVTCSMQQFFNLKKMLFVTIKIVFKMARVLVFYCEDAFFSKNMNKLIALKMGVLIWEHVLTFHCKMYLFEIYNKNGVLK